MDDVSMNSVMIPEVSVDEMNRLALLCCTRDLYPNPPGPGGEGEGREQGQQDNLYWSTTGMVMQSNRARRKRYCAYEDDVSIVMPSLCL